MTASLNLRDYFVPLGDLIHHFASTALFLAGLSADYFLVFQGSISLKNAASSAIVLFQSLAVSTSNHVEPETKLLCQNGRLDVTEGAAHREN